MLWFRPHPSSSEKFKAVPICFSIGNSFPISSILTAIMARVALNDPGKEHGVVYAWTTYGIGYNEKMVADAVPVNAD